MKSVLSFCSRVAHLASTPLAPSHYLALVSPLAATHALHARVEAIKDETADVRTLALRHGSGWVAHRAGQHLRVSLSIAGRLSTRTFTISSSPDRRDGCITITVKAIGRVSRALVREVRVGDYLAIGRPEGEFVLPDAPAPLLFVTGGTGMTPIASMVRSLASRMPDVVHLHFAKTARDVIFGNELRALAAAEPRYRLSIVHTREDSRRFSIDTLDALAPDWRARQTYACGPQPLLDAVVACIPAVRVERFHTAIAPALDSAASTGGRVRFCASGMSARADGRTPLLRVAEDAGVAAAHGCRMGICHTCDVTLLGGCVRDLRTGARIDEPGTRVQVCVCAAAGDVDLAL